MNKAIFVPNSEIPSQDVSATQKAYQAIRRMIVMAELKPGEKLKINHLKEMLDTGASPIREALSLLTSDQRGFRAAPANRANFDEILTLRCSLEDMALRQSIALATDDWEENIVLCHHRMVRESRENSELFEQHHKAFHTALIMNCNSPILLKFCSQLYDLNVRYRYLANQSRNYQSRDVSEEHQGIMQAALDKDTEAASERLLQHYRQTGVFLASLFG